MSQRPPAPALTPHEVLVLAALRNHGPATLASLLERTALCATQLNGAQRALNERGLLTTDHSPKRRVPMVLTVSMAGNRALLAHQRAEAAKAVVVVAPPTYNTHGTHYEPPKRVFYRNAGNAHIASHGVGC